MIRIRQQSTQKFNYQSPYFIVVNTADYKCTTNMYFSRSYSKCSIYILRIYTKLWTYFLSILDVKRQWYYKKPHSGVLITTVERVIALVNTMGKTLTLLYRKRTETKEKKKHGKTASFTQKLSIPRYVRMQMINCVTRVFVYTTGSRQQYFRRRD